jgi:hypothetical protein
MQNKDYETAVNKCIESLNWIFETDYINLKDIDIKFELVSHHNESDNTFQSNVYKYQDGNRVIFRAVKGVINEKYNLEDHYKHLYRSLMHDLLLTKDADLETVTGHIIKYRTIKSMLDGK